MADIVERLRETQDDWPACLVELEIEAADEIERLREENARLREALEGLQEIVARKYEIGTEVEVGDDE